MRTFFTAIESSKYGFEFTVLADGDGKQLGVPITDLGPDPRDNHDSDIRWSAGAHMYFDETPEVTTPSQLASRIAETLKNEP